MTQRLFFKKYSETLKLEDKIQINYNRLVAVLPGNILHELDFLRVYTNRCLNVCKCVFLDKNQIRYLAKYYLYANCVNSAVYKQ